MTLPASGAISLSQVNTELGLSSTAMISLNASAVRTLFGKASGAISMSDGYGKANQFAFTISANQTNANLRTLAVNAGWNQSSKVVATIASGVTISSNSTGTAALVVSGSFPGGVELVNNGAVTGMGGAGGRGSNSNVANAAGLAGGAAFSASVAITVTNNGSLNGGGGGGGGGGSADNGCDMYGCTNTTSGSGGGGGRSSPAANSAGGLGGASMGGTNSVCVGNPGNAGTSSAAGTGGAAKVCLLTGGAGGTGGGYGAAGSAGSPGYSPYGGTAYPNGGGSGGAGGAAVVGNSNITWVATGTRLGAIT